MTMKEKLEDLSFEKVTAWTVELIGNIIQFFMRIMMEIVNPRHLPLYWGVAGAAMIFLAGRVVVKLFTASFGVDPVVAFLNAVASVGVLVILMAITITSTNNAVKGLGYMFVSLWIPLVLGLIAVAATLNGQTNVFTDESLPKNLIVIGKVTAVLLPGLALLPVIMMPIANKNAQAFQTPGVAASHYFKMMFAIIILLASTFANIEFGQRLKLPPEIAILFGVILESMYLWSLLQGIRAEQNKDKFDVIVWSVVQTINVLVLGFVAIETSVTLTKMEVPWVETMKEYGKVIYVSAILLGLIETLVAELLTRWINWPMDAKPKPKNAPPNMLNKIGNAILERISDAPKGNHAYNATGSAPNNTPPKAQSQ